LGPEGAWSISRILKNPSSDSKAIREEVSNWTACPINFFLVGPGLEIKSVIESAGTKSLALLPMNGLVRLQLDYRSSQARSPDLAGWVQFDSLNSWVLKAFDFQQHWSDGTTGSNAATFQYQENTSSFPLLKRIERRMQNSRGYDTRDTYEFDFREGDVPESAFTLPAFGFAEPGGVPEPPSTPWFLWVALAGTACFLGGLFIRRWTKRNAR
jgi:hypothetical protein